MKLSVVIPAYNEEDNIRQTIMDVLVAFPSAEIIVINDASTDRTYQIISDLALPNIIIITNMENQGHGYSVVRGLEEATGDSILYIDADRQIDINNIKQVEPDQYDFVSGQRVHRHDKLFRKVISVCLRYTILLRHGMYIKDSNCPFKLYRKEALVKVIGKLPKSYVVPIACLEVLARKEGLTTKIIPTPHKPYDGIREGFLQIPNLNFFRFVGKAFMEMVRL
jgi:dolichol-phosphate mannosyltransferase